MRRILRHIILATLCIVPYVVQAQTDIQLSQYWAAPSYYNAGATGQGDKMFILAGTRQQWLGIEGAPSSFWGRADMPLRFLGGHHGIGIAFSSTQEGLFSNMVFGAQYAYKLKIKKSYLCFGVQLGLVDQKFDGSKVEIPSSDHHTPPGQDEDIPTTEVSGMAFDAAFGIYYVHPYFHVGLSATHLTEPTVRYQDTGSQNDNGYEFFVPRQFYFMAGGNIPVKNSLITIQPYMQVMTDLVSWRASMTALGTYSYDGKDFFAGVTYSPMVSVAFILGVEMKSITVSYAYELFTSGVGAENGNHDIFIGYKVDLEIFKKGKNKHNSIRILQ